MTEYWQARESTHSAQRLGPPDALLLPGDTLNTPRLARTFVREYLRSHLPDPPDDHVDTVVLVISELVTNACRYGTEPEDSIKVVVNAGGSRTRIEGHDTRRRRPHVKPESTERVRGRGLLIVEALAEWGVDDRPFGKIVWAHVPLEASA